MLHVTLVPPELFSFERKELGLFVNSKHVYNFGLKERQDSSWDRTFPGTKTLITIGLSKCKSNAVASSTRKTEYTIRIVLNRRLNIGEENKHNMERFMEPWFRPARRAA